MMAFRERENSDDEENEMPRRSPGIYVTTSIGYMLTYDLKSFGHIKKYSPFGN